MATAIMPCSLPERASRATAPARCMVASLSTWAVRSTTTITGGGSAVAKLGKATERTSLSAPACCCCCSPAPTASTTVREEEVTERTAAEPSRAGFSLSSSFTAKRTAGLSFIFCRRALPGKGSSVMILLKALRMRPCDPSSPTGTASQRNLQPTSASVVRRSGLRAPRTVCHSLQPTGVTNHWNRHLFPPCCTPLAMRLPPWCMVPVMTSLLRDVRPLLSVPWTLMLRRWVEGTAAGRVAGAACKALSTYSLPRDEAALSTPSALLCAAASLPRFSEGGQALGCSSSPGAVLLVITASTSARWSVV
mmetsp:Transcript_38057/g.107501  ORF Transcript_38057/g.107501 Transcript_38057/m.107501 type:complete len:307 (+) Transcript_38057:1834-2754(+)